MGDTSNTNDSCTVSDKQNSSCFSNVTSGSDTSDPYEEYLTGVRTSVNIANAGLLATVMPFILFGNCLVILSIYRFRHLRTSMNMFLVSLSFSDILVAIPTIPLYIAFYVKGEFFGKYKYICLLRYAAVVGSLSGSIISLTFVTFDRYVAVIHPLYYHVWMTKKKAKRIIAGIWTYDVIASSIPMCGYNDWAPGVECEFFSVLPRPYAIFTTSFVLAVCLTTSIFMYTRIFIAASRHKKRLAKMNVNSAHKRKSKRQLDKDTRMAKIMAFIFLLFVMFWFPFQISSLMKFLPYSKQIFEMSKNLSLTLAMSNSMVNPIVYGLLRDDFRVAFQTILGFRTTPATMSKYASSRGNRQRIVSSGVSNSEMSNLEDPVFQISNGVK